MDVFASSVGRASEIKSEDCGFDSHVKLTFYLELQNLSIAVNTTYMISPNFASFRD